MATQTQNWLKYTGLTYAEILKQVTDKLKADPRFDNFRESAIAQTMNEIFTGAVDLANYYIERQAEESFFETSQRDSSAILNSRNLAYDITRPIPASTTIKISITGNMTGRIIAGRKLQFPIFTKFTYQNNDYILKKGFTHTFTTDDQQKVTDQGDNYSKDITVDDNGDAIVLIQGTLKSKTIYGNTNPQVGQIFQSYKIPDITFSNLYGNADLPDYPTTRVWVGTDQSNANEYIINRRSLINDDTIAGIISGNQVKCCVIRTAVDGDVELKFGTGKINSTLSIGHIGADVYPGSPNTTFDDIIIQYLSTNGTKANLIGIIGEKLTYSNQIMLSTFNITGNIVFKFVTNITGGGDIETSESIKTNAPGIFYSLDRAVNVQDHVNILKSLTSPIDVKNAIAWGEQEEAAARGVAAIVELFNVGFFTCVGSLYNLEGDPNTVTYSVKTNDNRIDEAVLDDDFDENAMSAQYYFNIFVKDMVARQIKEQIISTWFWEIDTFLPVASDHGPVYFSTTYPTPVSITFIYSSDKFMAGTSLQGTISVDLSSIITMTDIATIFQTALRAQIDYRSSVVGGLEQNGNYGNPMFPGITVTWDSITQKFTITNATSDPCYLNYIESIQEQLVRDLGMYNTDPFNPAHAVYAVAGKINININYNLISQKIMDVLNILFKKGQITLKYIYASPIIQGFKLEGTIYVNQLYSVDDEHRETDNAVYSFLDENADFNKEIYISNIIDEIENSPGIDHADVKFTPDIPYPDPIPNINYNVTFYFPVPGYYQTIDKYGDKASVIYTTIATILSKYTGNLIYGEPEWREYISNTRNFTPDLIYQDPYMKKITERYFLSIIIKDLYNSLVIALGASSDFVTEFQDSPDFISVVSDIHKDLSWIIRSNMIDSNGNISPEYQITPNDFGINTKTLLRGGYSLGCEIAKLNLEATAQNKTPYLVYEYKS